jgi:hypothetical protein
MHFVHAFSLHYGLGQSSFALLLQFFFFHIAVAILLFCGVVALVLFLHVAKFCYLSYDNCLKYLTHIIL